MLPQYSPYFGLHFKLESEPDPAVQSSVPPPPSFVPAATAGVTLVAKVAGTINVANIKIAKRYAIGERFNKIFTL